MSKSCNSMFNFSVKRQEPTLVRPSEETYKGEYFLSSLDLASPVINRTIHCFRSNERDNEEAAEIIKNALAKVLVQYYPLAGRLKLGQKGKYVVDCTGEGAVFVSAEANCQLEDLGDMTLTEMNLSNLVYDVDSQNIFDCPPLVAQVTKFHCGGFVLGMCMHHMIFDGFSAGEFTNSWGETARGITLTVPPSLDRTILRARDPPKFEHPVEVFHEIEDISNINELYNEEIVYRCFSFNPNQLQKLKCKALEDEAIAKCTTFQALSALVWRARTTALRMQPDQPTRIIMNVDIRPRISPPLPRGYSGNAFVRAHSTCSARELLENPLSHAVQRIQNSIEMVADSFIRSEIDYYDVVKTPTHSEITTGRIATRISAWTRLPFNTTDFGWEEPLFWGPVTMNGNNVRFLPNGADKTAINLVMGLPTTAMETFEGLIRI